VLTLDDRVLGTRVEVDDIVDVDVISVDVEGSSVTDVEDPAEELLLSEGLVVVEIVVFIGVGVSVVLGGDVELDSSGVAVVVVVASNV
jgi:hypothetical protein